MKHRINDVHEVYLAPRDFDEDRFEELSVAHMVDTTDFEPTEAIGDLKTLSVLQDKRPRTIERLAKETERSVADERWIIEKLEFRGLVQILADGRASLTHVGVRVASNLGLRSTAPRS